MSVPSPDRWREATERFGDLVELSAAERAAAMAALAASDPELARIVAGLLESDAQAGGFLEEPVAAYLPSALLDFAAGGTASRAGEEIGAYRVVSLLGQGGAGEVYLAERADGQYEQQVALKLLRPGVGSDGILRRFLRERQILARLEHPGIARLLDGGLTAAGQPYLVMERVEGEPITAWCAARELPLERRLELVIACCDAVAAAHRNLVVHRDLKPGNVMVTPEGRVKLLDFGIAKLLAEGSDAELTRLEGSPLTPAYAAPEQILGEPVTTATDVYGLGVLLYELLTGRLPHRRPATSTARLAEEVRRETVDRPSAAVLAAAAAEDVPAAERRRRARRLRGDLDSIVMRALAREPERRYPTAAALGDDLRRHLDGLPVTARPDGIAYRASRFATRHRGGVAAAALALLALVSGLGVALWQAAAARAQAERAERVKEYLIGLFRYGDPEQGAGGTAAVGDLLAEAGRRLPAELADDPALQADLMEALARIQRSLGLLEPARRLAEGSLRTRTALYPPDDPRRGESLATLAAVMLAQGRTEAAEAALAEALPLLAARGGDPLTLLAAQADHARLLDLRGDVRAAAALAEQVHDGYRRRLGDGDVRVAVALGRLGGYLADLDRLDEAEDAFRRARAALGRTLPAEHPLLAAADLDLARILQRRGRVAEAEPMFHRVIEVRRRRLGTTHPATAEALAALGSLYVDLGNQAEAERWVTAANAAYRAVDPNHFGVATTLHQLASVRSRRGDHVAAEALLREAVERLRRTLGDDQAFTWQATGSLAIQLMEQGRLAEAAALQRQALERIEAITGGDSEETAQALMRLGETLRLQGEVAEAALLHRRALDLQRRLVGEDHAYTALAAFQVGADLAASPDPADRAEARQHLDRALATLRPQGPDAPGLAATLDASARLALLHGDRDRARRELAEAHAMAVRRYGAGHTETLAALAALRELD